VFSYNDTLGWLLNVIAVICMIASGAVLPLMNLLFGKFINKFNDFANGTLSAEDYRNQLSAYAYVSHLFPSSIHFGPSTCHVFVLHAESTLPKC
jgi:ATP-binding cassette subfamily B (MDR/TAP) protein 1